MRFNGMEYDVESAKKIVLNCPTCTGKCTEGLMATCSTCMYAVEIEDDIYKKELGLPFPQPSYCTFNYIP